MTLEHRFALVTGASTGLGFAIAAKLVAAGSSVAICARRAAELEWAVNSLRTLTTGCKQIYAQVCDVSSEDQVNAFVAAAVDQFGRVDILVNNAAIQGAIGPTEQVSLAEWRRTYEVNLYGTLFTCRALIPHMRSHGYGKIINLSGGGAASPRPFFSAYATSKAAVVRLTENLAEELRPAGIDINAIAPGALNTQMLEQSLAAGPGLMGEHPFQSALQQKQNGGSSLDRAADLCVYLASAESDGITGRLVSAPWDPWPTLHHHKEALVNSDHYTLRRVVPVSS